MGEIQLLVRDRELNIKSSNLKTFMAPHELRDELTNKMNFFFIRIVRWPPVPLE